METQTSITSPEGNSSGGNTVLFVVIILIIASFGFWWYKYYRTPAAPADNPSINVDVNLPNTGPDNGQGTPSVGY